MSNTNDPTDNLHPDILAGILPPDQQEISGSDEPWWLEDDSCCTECDRPAHWGRTREGVCRQCHEESRRDPSADTEGPEVRGY